MTTIVYEPSQTTHWKNLFASKTMLLGAHNLNEGEELVCQIQSVSIQKIKNTSGKDEQVPVCTFNNAPPMVLNITNTKTIASLYGENYDSWAGKYIQVFATKVKAFGQEQMALRVRLTKPNVGENTAQYESGIRKCKDLKELQNVYMALPKHLKQQLSQVKDEMKARLSNA